LQHEKKPEKTEARGKIKLFFLSFIAMQRMCEKLAPIKECRALLHQKNLFFVNEKNPNLIKRIFHSVHYLPLKLLIPMFEHIQSETIENTEKFFHSVGKRDFL
jgi:hypothetical protein